MTNRRKVKKSVGRGGAGRRQSQLRTAAAATATGAAAVLASQAVSHEPGLRGAPAKPARHPGVPPAEVAFLGFALDADEREVSLREKRSVWDSSDHEIDPFTAVLERLEARLGHPLAREAGIRVLGSVNLPPWLRPMPPASQAESLSVSSFAGFVDGGGCLTGAATLAGLIEEQVFPAVPCLIAVDHCLAGGAMSALSARLGPENLSVVVLDAHTDAIPVPVTEGAVQYDAETNPASVYDRDHPLLQGRSDSYNASSFLHHLLQQGVVLPENLYLLGVADYPPSRAFKLQDERIVRYTSAFSDLKRRGVKVLTRDDLALAPGRADWELGRIRTPYVYVSVDLDVGAGESLQGVRFRERRGLSPAALGSLAGSLGRLVERVELAGLDLSELNPRLAGPGSLAPQDRTYDFACLFLEELLGERLH